MKTIYNIYESILSGTRRVVQNTTSGVVNDVILGRGSKFYKYITISSPYRSTGDDRYLECARLSPNNDHELVFPGKSVEFSTGFNSFKELGLKDIDTVYFPGIFSYRQGGSISADSVAKNIKCYALYCHTYDIDNINFTITTEGFDKVLEAYPEANQQDVKLRKRSPGESPTVGIFGNIVNFKGKCKIWFDDSIKSTPAGSFRAPTINFKSCDKDIPQGLENLETNAAVINIDGDMFDPWAQKGGFLDKLDSIMVDSTYVAQIKNVKTGEIKSRPMKNFRKVVAFVNNRHLFAEKDPETGSIAGWRIKPDFKVSDLLPIKHMSNLHLITIRNSNVCLHFQRKNNNINEYAQITKDGWMVYVTKL